MPAQIRPTRLDVTDRFPMVAFKIRAEGGPSRAQVAIGVDPSLFTVEGKKNRTAANFYSTNGNGGVRFVGEEAGYTLPPEVLARFIGNEKLYFGLATAGDGGPMKVAVMPSTSSPYISIKGLSGRSMARVRVLPNRQQRAAGYSNNGLAQLEWAGDTAQPGMAPVANGGADAAAKNGKANGAATAEPYDDGFGPMPGETPAGAAPAPTAQGLGRRQARGFDYADDPEARGIEGPAYSEAEPLPSAQARAFSVPTPDYPRASRFAASPAFNTGRSGQTIDRIVIHITDAPTTSSTVNHFTAAGAQASAHYLVGQDGEVVQFVAEANTAWHAKGANLRSIGIEHVAIKVGGVDYKRPNGTVQHFNHLPPTDTQYCESAALVTHLCDKYGLTPDRTTIIGHREADPKTSHTSCPDGAWNWDHFMDLVTSRQCKAQPAATGAAQGLSLRPRKGAYRPPMAGAMVVGLEDRQKARKYARDYIDLFQWSPRASVVSELTSRGFSVQTLDAAVGDLNLDFYKVLIRRFPPNWDAPKLLQFFIRNINSFVNTTLCSFDPFDPVDVQRLASSDPLGTVFELDMFGPDNAAIVISDVKPQFYAVTTINTPRTGDHPVSGHRQFGYFVVDGRTTFYTRGADRATLGFPGTETAIFKGGEMIWEGFQSTLAGMINNMGGEAEVLDPFSERFNAQAVREEFGRYDVAHSLGMSRAFSAGAFTVNWDEVELIPQPNNFTCWAAAGAMLIGWRDRVSLTPETIGQICSRSTTAGLNPGDVERFAGELGLIAEPPVSYSIDGFRGLLEAVGPLWVAEALPNSLHAIIVTGMYSDGVNTFVRIADPWDRAVGTPGAPGNYAATHTTGSRYIMRYEDFHAQYEAAINGNPPNRQILHSGNPNALVANTGQVVPPPGYAQSYARSNGRTSARGLSGGQSFTINWDEVQQIAQPTNVSCWATAASMVLGWRDRMSLTVEGIAEQAGLTTATGLDPAAVGQFAIDMGMTAEAPQSYTTEAFRQLLENNGPLWVGAAVPGLHAIVVTGLYEDGNGTFVRITDPWDRDVGAPGSPGAYAKTHATGSRYIMRWIDFVAEYERAATDFSRVNLQILHCGGTHGHTANTGQGTPSGYAMSYARGNGRPRARGLSGGQSFTINWDEVQQIAQPTNVSCWATAASMVVGWRDRMSLTIEGIAERAGLTTATGLDPAAVGQFATDMGMTAEPPQSYTIDAFRQLLENNGPLWVGAAVPSLHVIVVTGLYSDGTDTFVRVTDPWDRDVGAPGSPGAYASTHATGSRYIMRWIDFVAEYERAATDFSRVNLQILHCGGTHGHTANTGQGTPSGYAMGMGRNGGIRLPAPPAPRARAQNLPIGFSGTVIEVERGSSGNVSWELDQLHGVKRPNDIAPTPGSLMTAPTIRLDSWPVSGSMSEAVSAWFSIDWQYDGASLGNIRIGNIGAQNAAGWKLAVRAHIVDDRIMPQPGSCASLRVELRYQFSTAGAADRIAITDVRLYGDGTHEVNSRWEQAALALGRPTARALKGGAGAVIAKVGEIIAGDVITQGGVTWQVGSFDGKKHPNDVDPNPLAEFRNATPITVGKQERGWLDVIGMDFQIDWQFNGTSIGPIRISKIWREDALLANLDVRGTIAHDNIVYDHRTNLTDTLPDGETLFLIPGFRGIDNPADRKPCAAMHVHFDFTWDEQFSGTSTVHVDIHLFGDGWYSHRTVKVQ